MAYFLKNAFNKLVTEILTEFPKPDQFEVEHRIKGNESIYLSSPYGLEWLLLLLKRLVKFVLISKMTTMLGL